MTANAPNEKAAGKDGINLKLRKYGVNTLEEH